MILKNTEYPICPYCNNENQDMLGYGVVDEWFLVKCSDCEKDYKVRIHVRVSYSTEK